MHKSKEPRLQLGLGHVQSAIVLALEALKRESMYGDERGTAYLEDAVSSLLKAKSRYMSLIRVERGE